MRRGREGSNKRMDGSMMQEKQWPEENGPKSESVAM